MNEVSRGVPSIRLFSLIISVAQCMFCDRIIILYVKHSSGCADTFLKCRTTAFCVQMYFCRDKMAPNVRHILICRTLGFCDRYYSVVSVVTTSSFSG